MRAAVIDASVAVKWVVAEDHSDRALAILRDVPSLHAPAHWLAEASTALWAMAAVHRVLSPSQFQARLEFLSGLPITVASLPQLIAKAGMVALDLRLTVYDTLYLALADELNVPMVTADRKLYERASAATQHRTLVRWIADVDLPVGPLVSLERP